MKRRIFLRNAAATLALPLLPSATEDPWADDHTSDGLRMVWYVPNGIDEPMDAFSDGFKLRSSDDFAAPFSGSKRR